MMLPARANAVQPPGAGAAGIFTRLAPAAVRRAVYCSAEKQKSVTRRLGEWRALKLLKQTVRGWDAAQGGVKRGGRVPQVAGKQELQKIAAFADWFRCVGFVLASADVLPFLTELWGERT